MIRTTTMGVLLAVAALASAASSTAAERPPLYRDARAPIERRVRDLLARMTPEEKAAQLRSMWFAKGSILDGEGAFSKDKALKAIPDGIGQLARPSDLVGTSRMISVTYRTIEDTVAFINGVQHYLVENTRLGIPALFHEETAHGYLAGDATVFPIPPALASTWDPALIEEVYAVTARQARVRGATVALSPVLDLTRDPRYGRAEEFFSEDPYLTAQMGIASVRGQQGHSRPLQQDKVFVTLKHFVHGVPQGGLNIAPAEVGERTLRENYLVPFAEVIRATNPAVMMPSYNEVGGVPSHGSAELLQATGRRRLGFTGAYFSDYGGVGNLATQHHMATDSAEAAALALTAGVDADLPEGESYKQLPSLLKNGRIAPAALDGAVARVLALKFEAGLFEHPYVDAARAVQQTDTPADVALARRVAERSLILLKNDGILPLDPAKPRKIAVIGPNAPSPLFGGYSGRNGHGVSILDGIRAAAGATQSIGYRDGVWIVNQDPLRPPPHYGPVNPVPHADNAHRIEAAVQLAQQSDIVLLVLGDNPAITREATAEFMPGDRNSLGLYGDQDELVDAVAATGKPIIALLLNGRPLAVTQLAAKANALVEGWYLGQQGGAAFADVLFGLANPGGKLTVSMPRSVGELPAFYNRHPSADVNKYVEGKRQPLFPFGFGLSYTTFEMSAPRLSKASIAPGEHVGVDVDVANTGTRAGDEVVQLYVRDDISSVPRPVLELKRFQRIALAPGEQRTVHFDLDPDALAFWDLHMKWTVEPGTFTIHAGNSSAALKSARLTVVARR